MQRLAFLKNFENFGRMPNLSTKDLEKIANALRAALQLIEAQIEEPPTPPPEVQIEVDRKVEQGICLSWDHKIEPGTKVIRGQCQTDYNTTMARIRRGEDDEKELILQGKLLAEGKKPGRRAARDIAAERAAKELKVAELAERYNNRKKPKDK